MKTNENVAHRLEAIHNQEINARIEWFFDSLIIVTLGDIFNGFGEQRQFTSFEEAISYLESKTKGG